MPSSSDSEQAPETDHVTLPSGLRFARRRSSSFPIELADGRRGSWSIAYRVTDAGDPVLVDYRLHVPGGLRSNELERPDLPGLLRFAFHHDAYLAAQVELGEQKAPGAPFVVLDDDELRMADERARMATKRGPYKLTDEFLREMLEWYGAGGIKRVMKEADTSERTARRWLKEATERGLR